ncbi:MAG TPA: hypothetical protein DCP92_10745 [Nitrospiraceae bacterium]|jgi:hypothetical protein|nr:hypothetical protein [Nitrospiraceae bacterium]
MVIISVKISAILTNNLLRELPMTVHKKSRGTTRKRTALWPFRKTDSGGCSCNEQGESLTPEALAPTMTLNANSLLSVTYRFSLIASRPRNRFLCNVKNYFHRLAQ